MEVNKEEAERCRDMGAAALRNGQYDRAVKLLKKSLSMYVLPGVEALLHQAEQRASSGTRSENNTSSDTPQRTTSSVNRSSSNATEGSDGRAYTEDQAKLVSEILRAKEGGRGAHYRVLGVSTNASDSDLKKAYRKRALQLHPDKNSAPHADEAFKAIGLAYATLSDPEKRNIYDRFGDEDPDNRGGGAAAARGPGGMHFRRAGAGEVDPEEIFNMFFGGMPMHGGNRGGVHFYTTGFGPGMRFGGAVPQRQPNAQQQPAPSLMAMFFNYLPFLIIMAMSFMNLQNNNGQAQNRYFSLTQTSPFTYPLTTKLTSVKDIPYFVTPRFMETLYRDRFQLAQVERMVENSYQQYLVDECKSQKVYKTQLLNSARNLADSDAREKSLAKANAFELSRCQELEDLFPLRSQHRQQRTKIY